MKVAAPAPTPAEDQPQPPSPERVAELMIVVEELSKRIDEHGLGFDLDLMGHATVQRAIEALRAEHPDLREALFFTIIANGPERARVRHHLQRVVQGAESLDPLITLAGEAAEA